MKFYTFEKPNESVKKTITLSKFVIALLITSALISNLFLGYQLYQAQKNVLVISEKGQIYQTKATDAKDTRIYEYENHVRMFYNYWYAFDENSFTDHIEKGLNLIGDTGKELYNEYNDIQIKTNLLQKNLRYEVQIQKININMNTDPVSGSIEGIQTCLRAQGAKSRTVCANFTLYDVARSRDNVHGVKIEKWQVYESKELAAKVDSINVAPATQP